MNFGGTFRLNKFACFTLLFILFLIVYWRSGGSSEPPKKNDLVNVRTMLKVAIHAAERGGKKVVEAKDQNLNIKSKGKTLEGINDPVTEADHLSHCAMYYSLRNVFPHVNVISEEHTSKCENQDTVNYDVSPADQHAIDRLNDEFVFAKDVTIWIDPLDATKEYTEGLYHYVTTMVCVAIKGVPVVGVIHFPFTTQTYWGWIPNAISPNIANLAQKKEKEHPRIVVSISHGGTVSDLAYKVFGAETTVLKAAGAGFKTIGVVNGTYDVYLHTSAIKKWDICAGNAILNAVDGEMKTTKGDKIDYSPKDSTDHKVTDGIIATRHDNDYYLRRVSSEISKNH